MLPRALVAISPARVRRSDTKSTVMSAARGRSMASRKRRSPLPITTHANRPVLAAQSDWRRLFRSELLPQRMYLIGYHDAHDAHDDGHRTP